jgi:hypothetical protein
MLRSAALVALALCIDAATAAPANPQIDYSAFEKDVAAVSAVRESRRISEADFIRMAREPGTVVLDARTVRLFELRHIAGARNLPFPEFTEGTLAAVIPARTTRVLIYCNNNFTRLPESMPTKRVDAALNLSTFVALHAYGYDNVYELGPVIDPAATRLSFAGREARS